MVNHVKRFHEESKSLPPNLPPRTSLWLVALFGAGIVPLGIFSFASYAGVVGDLLQGASRGQYWYWNTLVTFATFLTFFSWFMVQTLAFVGLAVRRDWALGLANLASLFWCFTVVGIIAAAIVYLWLRRSWSHNQTGVAADAPGSVQLLFTVTTFLVVAWAVFAVFIDQLIRSIFQAQGLGGADQMVSIMFVTGLPAYLLQGAAWYGLHYRKVWGREAASAAAVALMPTIIGIPFGYWALKNMWPEAGKTAAEAAAPA